MSDALIRFAAPLALLDTWTTDGRMLVSPADGEVRHRPFPIPLRAVVDHVYVLPGAVDGLSLEDGVLTASGFLEGTDKGRACAKHLEDGTRFLELDVDDVRMVEPRQKVGLVMSGWRVTGAVLGTHPCWGMQPARITWPESTEESHRGE